MPSSSHSLLPAQSTSEVLLFVALSVQWPFARQSHGATGLLSSHCISTEMRETSPIAFCESETPWHPGELVRPQGLPQRRALWSNRKNTGALPYEYRKESETA